MPYCLKILAKYQRINNEDKNLQDPNLIVITSLSTPQPI